ncbi:hypothetical protein CPB84DRAFT_1746694 [Gymnopilus junonius]|uniref:Uncharacterized protein n=1 Tax=Gymnopilus junonius TaxID=109634 RepID=A0A9P5NSN1_GYMJU|nr:hypothetical protein CPB84DRAFT_1746694 [Gymnopilus junonius]
MAHGRKATKSVKKKAAPLPSPSVVSVPLLPSTLTPTMAPPPSAPSVLPPVVALSPPPVSAPPVPLQRRRGAKATTYIFSDAQLTHLNDLIPQFVAEVKCINPDLKPHNATLTKWKKATSKAVMKLDLFKMLITPQKQLKKWEEVHFTPSESRTIQQRFTNYYNNALKPRLHSQRSNPLENITNVVTTKAPALLSKPVENTLAQAMGIFSSQVPTCEIFAFENPELLQAKIDEVKKCQLNLFGGALHNIALSELMASDEVNNNEWEAKALAIKGDIDGNQNEFPLLMTQAINNIISRGVLGSVLTSFSYAYRNSAGGIGYGTIYNGYNAELKERINWKFEDHEAKVAAWMTTADHILPHNMSATGRQIADVLVNYFEALWDFSKPSTTMIPWKDITSSPVKYYDTLASNSQFRSRTQLHTRSFFYAFLSGETGPGPTASRDEPTDSTESLGLVTMEELTPGVSLDQEEFPPSEAVHPGIMLLPSINLHSLLDRSPMRKSTHVSVDVLEKRKAEASVRPTKKIKHSWVNITEDDDGNLWDEQGRRCDKKGNPL